MNNWLEEFLSQGVPLMPATKLAHIYDIISEDHGRKLAECID